MLRHLYNEELTVNLKGRIMLKIATLLALMISAGMSFSINASMCEKIATDPNTMIPVECQNYSEKKAQKAFDKTKKKHANIDDRIEFSKDVNDKQD